MRSENSVNLTIELREGHTRFKLWLEFHNLNVTEHHKRDILSVQVGDEFANHIAPLN